jgi:subtilisin family serine protease
MIPRRPAYSAPFAPDALQPVEQIEPFDSVTREWAWAGSSGKGVRVAIIDSGIDAGHPDVGEVAGYVSISEGSEGLIFVTEPHDDLFGHGTACASIIRRVAPECELYSVRVLGPNLSGRGAVFAAGLKWAIEHNMHVCNLSLGTTKRDLYATFHELADVACFRNVMLVTAANNMPVPSFPSIYASVISVACHEERDPYLIYYNPRPPVEFGAPGIDVRVAWKDGGYVTSTGNSYAAPHVSGIVAKILGKHPDLTVFQMKTVLRALAANVSREAREVCL